MASTSASKLPAFAFRGNAFTLLGTVCYLVGQERSRGPLVAVMVCVSLLLALAIGISRVGVGEHWATDILGGWLFGSAWLLVLISIHRRWSSMQGRPRTAQSAEQRAPTVLRPIPCLRGESHVHSPFGIHTYHEAQSRCHDRRRPTPSRYRQQRPLTCGWCS